MLLSVLLDENEEDEGYVSALFQVGDQVLQLKQKPQEGRLYDKDKEDRQEVAMAQPDADADPTGNSSSTPAAAKGEEYDSAFPNVGLVVWQAGFVLGEYLLRTAPLGPWKQGPNVLELGCGTGQLGIVLALAGAAVTLTDLEHIVPLTAVNVDLNASRCAIKPVCAAYVWGTPAEQIPQQAAAAAVASSGQQQQPRGEPVEQLPPVATTAAAATAPGNDSQPPLTKQQQPQQEQQQQQWDLIVAADVLYEPQHYDELLHSLMQLCPPSPATSASLPQQQQQPGNVQPADLDVAAGSSPANGGQQQQPQSKQSPPVYICYRRRVYDEGRFEAKAAKCGFAVEHVATEQLHKEYQCGGYKLMRMQRQ